MTLEQYKEIVAAMFVLGCTWLFALFIATILIWWEKSTKNVFWRWWDR